MAWVIRHDLPTHTAGGNTCYICRTDPRRDPRSGLLEPMMDPNIHIEFEGYLIICSTCIKEGAHQLGMLSEREQMRLAERDLSLTAKIDELQIRADAAETALDALRRYELVAPKEGTDGNSDSGPSLLSEPADAGLAGEELDEGAGAPARRSPRGRR